MNSFVGLCLLSLVLLPRAEAGVGGSEAHGMPSPERLSCLYWDGEWQVFRLNAKRNGLGVCVFGQAQIESGTFYSAADEGKNLLAVGTLLAATGDAPSASCAEFQARQATVFDSHRNPVEWCFFSDGSSMALSTLRGGRVDPANQRLVEILTRPKE